MNNFFRYPGGKRKILPLLLDTIKKAGPVEEYREPFFGGGSVGLGVLKTDIQKFWFNDLDPGIYCVWYAVFNYPEELLKQLKKQKITTNNFYQKQKNLQQTKIATLTQPQHKIKIAVDKIFVHQTSYSGLGAAPCGPIGGKAQKGKYKVDCRWSLANIEKKIGAITALAKGKKIYLSCLDYRTLLIDSIHPALIYLDPPYYQEGKKLYLKHFSHNQHVEMAERLKCVNHKFLLSYDECPEILDLYRNFNTKPINLTYSINSIRSKNELLIGNYEFKN